MPLMMENPVKSPIVPPIADSLVSKFAFSSLVIRSKVGVENLISTQWRFVRLLDSRKSELYLKICFFYVSTWNVKFFIFEASFVFFIIIQDVFENKKFFKSHCSVIFLHISKYTFTGSQTFRIFLVDRFVALSSTRCAQRFLIRLVLI